MANKSYLNYEDELKDEKPYSSVSDRDPLEELGLDALMSKENPDEDLSGILDDKNGTDNILNKSALQKLLEQSGDEDLSGILDDKNGTDNILNKSALQKPLEQSGTQSPEEEAQSSADAPPVPSNGIPSPRDLVRQSIMMKFSGPAYHYSYENDPIMKDYKNDLGKMNEFRDVKRQADGITNMGQALSHLALGANAPQSMDGFYKGMDSQNDRMLKSQEGDLDRKQRIMSTIENRLARQSVLEMRKNDKLDRQNTLRLDKMNQLITAERASPGSAFGKAALARQTIDNAQAMINGELDPNDLDPRQVYETAKVLDRVLSGSGTTVAGTEHLTPSNSAQTLALFKEYFTNQRQGAGAGDFITSMNHTLDREKIQANKQIRDAQNKVKSSFGDLEQYNPKGWDAVMTAQGLKDIPTQDQSNQRSRVRIKTPAPHSQFKYIPQKDVDAAVKAGAQVVD